MPVSSPSHHAQRALEVAACRRRPPARTRCRWPRRSPPPRSRTPITGATGPKISSLQQARVRRHVAEHGRLVEVAGAVDAPGRPTSAFAPLPTASSTSSATLRALVVVDQRADLHALLGAAADLQRAHLARPAARRTPSATAVGHVEAVGGRARLADVAHLRHHRALDRGVEIGVLEHEERRVAAQLHRHLAAPARRPAPSACAPPRSSR